jgi:hypothetical protein
VKGTARWTSAMRASRKLFHKVPSGTSHIANLCSHHWAGLWTRIEDQSLLGCIVLCIARRNGIRVFE